MAGWTTTWPVAFGDTLTFDRYLELYKAIRERAIMAGAVSPDAPDYLGEDYWGIIDYVGLPPKEPQVGDIWFMPKWWPFNRPDGGSAKDYYNNHGIITEPSNTPPPTTLETYQQGGSGTKRPVGNNPTGDWAGNPNTLATILYSNTGGVQTFYWTFETPNEKIYTAVNDGDAANYTYWTFEDGEWWSQGGYTYPYVTVPGYFRKWNGSIWERQKRITVWDGYVILITEHMRAYFDSNGIVYGCDSVGKHIPVGFQNIEQPQYSTDWMGIKDLQTALLGCFSKYSPDKTSSYTLKPAYTYSTFLEACGVPLEGRMHETLDTKHKIVFDQWPLVEDDAVHGWQTEYFPEGSRYFVEDYYWEGDDLAIGTYNAKIAEIHWIPDEDGCVSWGNSEFVNEEWTFVPGYEIDYQTPSDRYTIAIANNNGLKYNAAEEQWEQIPSGFTRKYTRKIVNLDSPKDVNGNDAALGQRARLVGGDVACNLYYSDGVYRAYSDPDSHNKTDNIAGVLVLDGATGEFEDQEGKIAVWQWTAYPTSGYYTFNDPHTSYVKLYEKSGRGQILSMACNCLRASSIEKQCEYTAEGGVPTAYMWCDGHWVEVDRSIYEHDGEKWGLSEDQESGPDIVTTYGLAEEGDILGPWILNEMYNGVRALRYLCSDAINHYMEGEYPENHTFEVWKRHNYGSWMCSSDDENDSNIYPGIAHCGWRNYNEFDYQGDPNRHYQYSYCYSPFWKTSCPANPSKINTVTWYQSPFYSNIVQGGSDSGTGYDYFKKNYPMEYTEFSTGYNIVNDTILYCPDRFYTNLGPDTSGNYPRALWVSLAIIDCNFEYPSA